MDLKRFFKENAKEIKTEKVIVSDRFTDEDGKALEWEIKSISAGKEEMLKDGCRIQGKKGSQDVDTSKFFRKVVVNCVQYPNLNDVELQNSYGAMSAEQLICEMLNGGEYNHLLAKVSKICGYDEAKSELEEAVDEAKK